MTLDELFLKGRSNGPCLRKNDLQKAQPSRQDYKFPVKNRDNLKIEKKTCIITSVFGYKNKGKYPIYISKNTFKRHVDLFLIG